jgi:hypothetical protein
LLLDSPILSIHIGASSNFPDFYNLSQLIVAFNRQYCVYQPFTEILDIRLGISDITFKPLLFYLCVFIVDLRACQMLIEGCIYHCKKKDK